MNVPPAPSAGPRRGRHVSRRLSARASGGSGEVKGSAPERSGGDDRLRQLDTAAPPRPHDMCHPHHVSSLRVVSARSQDRAAERCAATVDRAAGPLDGRSCFGPFHSPQISCAFRRSRPDEPFPSVGPRHTPTLRPTSPRPPGRATSDTSAPPTRCPSRSARVGSTTLEETACCVGSSPLVTAATDDPFVRPGFAPHSPPALSPPAHSSLPAPFRPAPRSAAASSSAGTYSTTVLRWPTTPCWTPSSTPTATMMLSLPHRQRIRQ